MDRTTDVAAGVKNQTAGVKNQTVCVEHFEENQK